jgi:hypothetical protein
MTKDTSVGKTTSTKTKTARLGTVCSLRLSLLLLLALPAMAQAQFDYTTNNGSITITKYYGPGGDVTIPSAINFLPVTSLGSGAFYGNTSVTSVTIPGTVTSLGAAAFYNCTSLATVTIADGATSIGQSAFEFCRSLTSIAVPNTVTNIGDLAFWSTGLTKFTMPSGLTSIGFGVFAYSPLSSITIPTNVTTIGDEAFFYCGALRGISIPNSVRSVGGNAFCNCTSLTNIAIPNAVASIGGSAFQNCAWLTNVAIGSGVTNIGGYAFYQCPRLAAITVDPANTVYSSVGGVLFDQSQASLIQCPEGKTGSYTIPNGARNVCDYAFTYCVKLAGVTIPNSVTNLGYHAFEWCTSLTGITVDPLNPVYSSADGVLFTKDQTKLVQFPLGKAGTYVFPNSATSIGDYAFSGCVSLTTLMIPEGITNIGFAAFNACTNLHSVILPSTLTAIWSAAFGGCLNLTAAYFLGDAPPWIGPNQGGGGEPFVADNKVTVYYLPGKTGWQTALGLGAPVVLWNPQMQTSDGRFGVRTNRFGFNVTGTANIPVVIEACTNLANPVWSPVSTNTLTNGSSYFSDSEWTNYPARLYRLRSP